MLKQTRKLILLSMAAIVDSSFIRNLLIIAVIHLCVADYYCLLGKFNTSYSIVLLGISSFAIYLAFIMWRTYFQREKIKRNILQQLISFQWPLLIAYVSKSIPKLLNNNKKVVCKSLAAMLFISVAYVLYNKVTKNKQEKNT
jgi:hypothetical protein